MKQKIIIPKRYRLSDWFTKHSYDVNSYHVAVSCLEEQIKNEEVQVEFFIGQKCYEDHVNDIDTLRNINTKNSCGSLLEIHDDYITISTKNKEILELFVFYSQNNLIPKAHMRFVGEKSIFMRNKKPVVRKIITFDIVFPVIPDDLKTEKIKNTLNKLKDYEGVSNQGYF